MYEEIKAFRERKIREKKKNPNNDDDADDLSHDEEADKAEEDMLFAPP